MLGHPVKELVSAWTLRVQVFKCEPLRMDQDRLAGEEPETAPASGLEARKLTLEGEAKSEPTVPNAAPSREVNEKTARRLAMRACPVPEARTATRTRTLPLTV